MQSGRFRDVCVMGAGVKRTGIEGSTDVNERTPQRGRRLFKKKESFLKVEPNEQP